MIGILLLFVITFVPSHPPIDRIANVYNTSTLFHLFQMFVQSPDKLFMTHLIICHVTADFYAPTYSFISLFPHIRINGFTLGTIIQIFQMNPLYTIRVNDTLSILSAFFVCDIIETENSGNSHHVPDVRITYFSRKREFYVAQISPSYLQIGATVGMLVMALLAIFIRMKASHRPVTIHKILIPPLGMSTGFLMFVVPQTHVPLLWALIALLVGWFIFSYPLIRSTRFERVNDEIFATRSRSFAFILLGLLAIRLILHEVIQRYVSIPQTGGLFFLLAFGMIVRWRVYMYKHYKEVVAAES